MKYMLLIYGSHAAWNRLTAADDDRLARVHEALQHELTVSGELVDTNELDPDQARVVRRENGVAVVTEGPFTESEDFLAGYYVVDCADLDRATDVAGRLMEAEFAPIEVRRVGRG